MHSLVAQLLHKMAAQVTLIPEQDTGQHMPSYPLLVS